MTVQHPAYELGRVIGAFNRAVQELGRAMVAGIADGLSGRVLERTDEQRERMAARAHRLRLEAERRQGLAFVTNYADQVRRDLGLPVERRGIR